MTRRHIHYEAAFEDYLRSRGLPYVAVDEHRKAIFAGGRVKSFDFLVYHKPGSTWLVDVKGRRFPYETRVAGRGGGPGPGPLSTAPGRHGSGSSSLKWNSQKRTSQKRYWENWVTREDLDGLDAWERAFGDGFVGMIVFAYHLLGPAARMPEAPVHCFRDASYAFLGIPARSYRAHSRQRSPKWDTLSMPAGQFRRMVQPLRSA